jgi:hypothetical protein
MRPTLPRQLLTFLRLALLVCFLCTASHVLAQATSAGTITGTVTDPSGAVIPGAVITVTDPSTKSVRTTTSNANGLYVLPDVPPGHYAVTAVKAGFSTDAIADLTISVGAQSTANFKLAIGAESTTVDVVASNSDLQTLNASTAETVDPQLVDSLPAIGRDVSSFAAFMPGVTPGGNVAGTVADQAVFMLDGGDNSSDMDGSMLSYTGSFGNSTTGGFLGASSSGVMPMPQDSVEEFRVATTGQTADFNNSSGMESNVVTKRGHDQWHGSAYEYYLDNNFNGNTWQNNFPTATFAGNTGAAAVLNGATTYTKKPSYHFSRFGGAAGGKLPKGHFLGGDTYVFANYEGFRYPLAATFERAVPSAAFLAGQLTFTGTAPAGSTCTNNGGNPATFTCFDADTRGLDPRHIGLSLNPVLKNFYQTKLPVAGNSYSGGTFDTSCSLVSSSYCDQVNTIGYVGNVLTPQTSNFVATRIDHDFGQKWHVNATFHYYKFVTTTSNQVDIGGGVAGDTVGAIKALAPRPQQPIYMTVGVTTNISSTLTNDFHASFLRNFWQWKNAGDAPQTAGWGGAIEPGGEGGATTGVLAPYNVNAQNTRTRIWDGKDTLFRDDVTKLKGNHLILGGGSFEHKNMYHQRTDNGNAINYSTTYQIGDAAGGGVVNYSQGLQSVGANLGSTDARIIDEFYGIVTESQVANTYTNSKGVLSLNPPQTSFFDNPHVPFYNIYATDTWKVKPNITFNYGLAYAIEMPPSEANGNQVMFTDASGNAIQVKKFLQNRAVAAQNGAVFNNAPNGINPEVGFALIKNVQNAPGGGKYPYNPFYGGVSPHVSVAWSPSGKMFGKLGDGGTVVRVGYSRIYGRINGDIQGLNPILSPGLVLATQCKYAQNAATTGAYTGTGGCTNNGSSFNDSTVFRFGPDGTTAPLFNAPANLTTPVYHPGFDGPGVAVASPVDPTFKPNYVDTINVSIQRQINRKTLIEVGYIGRNIRNELLEMNPNAVPYMLSQGGQTFAAAYANIEGAFGCTISASLCAKSAVPTVTPQPFFETALGGTGSAYCGSTSCTQAVVNKNVANFRTQKVFNIYSGLDNNVNGAGGAGFLFPRTLMGTPVTNTANPLNGVGGQVGSGMTVATSNNYGNYNGVYVSVKTTNYHGLTLQENLTYSKALGINPITQATSGNVPNDSYNLSLGYGVDGYNQKYIFNTFIVWQIPYYQDQHGVIGRVLGGWTVAPVVTAGTGQPLNCYTNNEGSNGGQSFGQGDGNNIGSTEQCIFTTPYAKSLRTNRGIFGGTDPNGVAVGTSVHKGSPSAAVNIFRNPAAVFDSVRAPILGLDTRDSGAGPIPGLGYLDLDVSVKKDIVVFERFKLQATGVFTNVMNHMEFANSSSSTISLQSVSSWGVYKSQGNNPRQIQMGLRASF